jgi:hypothetical protein
MAVINARLERIERKLDMLLEHRDDAE